MLKERMTEEAKKLASENHPLIKSFIKRYNIDFEEYSGVVAIGFCIAAMKYSKDKGTFPNFAYRCMYTEFVKCYNRRKTMEFPLREVTLSLDTEYSSKGSRDPMKFSDSIPNNENIEDAVATKIMLEHCLEKLNSDRKREAVRMILDGQKVVDIAEKLGCTFQNVSLYKKEFKEILKNYLKRGA